MKLKKLLSILDKECEVTIIDNDGVDVVSIANKVPKDIRERMVKSLYRASSDLPYDFFIVLKV